jgi:hypothetical protein
MVTAQELIVAIRSEGVRDTVADLRGVEDSMQETKESTADAADQAEGFSSNFKGAMSAAVTALAVGAAGLLSQVPVVSSVFAGLGAIIDSVVIKMDETLRPILTPLTDLFFGLAKKISNADGVFGDIIGVVATVGAGLAVLAGIITTVGAAAGSFTAGLGALSTAASVVGGAITAVGGTLLSLPVILGAVIAAVVAFVAAYILNIGGVRDKTNSILSEVFDFFVGLGSDILEWGKSTAASALEKGKDIAGDLLKGIQETGAGIIEWFRGLGQDIESFGERIVNAAFNIGKNIVAGIVKGLAGAAEFASGVVDTISNAVGIDLSIDDVPDFSSVTLGNGAENDDSTGTDDLAPGLPQAAATDGVGGETNVNPNVVVQPQASVGSPDQSVSVQPEVSVGSPDQSVSVQPEVSVGSPDQSVSVQPEVSVGSPDQSVSMQPEIDPSVAVEPQVSVGSPDQSMSVQPQVSVGSPDQSVSVQEQSEQPQLDLSLGDTPSVEVTPADAGRQQTQQQQTDEESELPSLVSAQSDRGNPTAGTFLDGRRVDESTGRFGRDATARRGP